jgi:hypothetical protein
MVLGGASGGRDYWSLLEVEVGQDSGRGRRRLGEETRVNLGGWDGGEETVEAPCGSEAGANIIGLLLLG